MTEEMRAAVEAFRAADEAVRVKDEYIKAIMEAARRQNLAYVDAADYDRRNRARMELRRHLELVSGYEQAQKAYFAALLQMHRVAKKEGVGHWRDPFPTEGHCRSFVARQLREEDWRRRARGMKLAG